MLSQDLEPEVLEIAIAVSAVDNDPNGPIDTFYEAIGHPVVEVVENLSPPVVQGLDELAQDILPAALIRLCSKAEVPRSAPLLR